MMIEWKSPNADELKQIKVSVSRALGVGIPAHRCDEIAFSRQGRFTICLLRVTTSLYPSFILSQMLTFAGAFRLDSADADNPDVGRSVALAKACRGLVVWLKEQKEREKIVQNGLDRIKESGLKFRKYMLGVDWPKQEGQVPPTIRGASFRSKTYGGVMEEVEDIKAEIEGHFERVEKFSQWTSWGY